MSERAQPPQPERPEDLTGLEAEAAARTWPRPSRLRAWLRHQVRRAERVARQLVRGRRP